MNEQKKQIRDKCPTDGDDFRTRYDEMENADNQQLEALLQLDSESKTAASGVLRDGRLIALQGRFPTETIDPVAAAIAFLGKHETAFGFAVGKEDAFTAPRLVEGDEGDVFHVVTNPLQRVGTLPRYHLNRVTTAPDMVLFPGEGLLLPEACTRNAVAVARAVFERFPKLFGTGDPASQLALGDVLTGPDPEIPTTTVVFHQRWGALPVFGCQLRVHLSRALAVRSISGNFLRDPGIETTTPAVSESAARIAASTTAAFDAPVVLDIRHNRKVSPDPVPITGSRAAISISALDRPAPTGSEPPYTAGDARAAALRQATNYHRVVERDPQRALTIGVPGAEDHGLTILPTSLIRSGHGRNHLAWWFRFPDSDRFISAATGASVLTLPRIPTAERVFDAANAIDPAAGVNPQFIDGNPQVPRAALDPDAQGAAGAVASVDSFWRIFHRDSWDGRGADMDAYVDWQDPGQRINAQWDGSRTMYRPQWATPDLVGHEFTHALTQATAGLVYLDESGAANEHYSDLFGNLIFPDTPATQWLVGEQIPGGPVRDMRNPAARTYQNYLIAQPTAAGDSGGVHTNSGILNRAAVLMCDGDASAPLPTGIGRSRLARLAWETLVYRLHPLSLCLGQTLENGRTLAEMEVRLFRRAILNGSMLMSTGGTFSAPDGSFTARIISDNRIGTANLGEFDEIIDSTTAVGIDVGNAETGAQVVSRTLGGRSLEVKVHSWHNAYTCVRYLLRYFVAGSGSSLPPFTMREL